MRLSYSAIDEDRIDEAVVRLEHALANMQRVGRTTSIPKMATVH